MEIFNLKNIQYEYANNHLALNNVSFCVDAGEQLTILGANGCGKSTLLKIMDGLISPSAGKIKAYGATLSEDLIDNNKNRFTQYFRQKVGLVLQNSDMQLFCPTVLDEVKFGPLQLNMKRKEADKRADDILSLLGISHLRNRSPHNLSGGEKKKVAIAATLSTNPEVLLLDEPTSGLDPRTEHNLIHLLLELKKAGKTIIVATHKLSLAQELCGRAIVIDEKHSLAVDGPVEDILANTKLLSEVNLIHEHFHKHGRIAHTHTHTHRNDHFHTD